jgi:hypothetical protein
MKGEIAYSLPWQTFCRSSGETQSSGSSVQSGNLQRHPHVTSGRGLHREDTMQAVKEDFRNLRTILDQGVEPPSQGATADQLALF